MPQKCATRIRNKQSKSETTERQKERRSADKRFAERSKKVKTEEKVEEEGKHFLSFKLSHKENAVV